MFKKFDLVEYGNKTNISVVLVGPLDIPYYNDGIASSFAYTPLDLENPDEWRATFTGYIVYNMVKDDYDIVAESNLSRFDKHVYDAYRASDQGTARLRAVLGLIALAKKCTNTDAP